MLQKGPQRRGGELEREYSVQHLHARLAAGEQSQFFEGLSSQNGFVFVHLIVRQCSDGAPGALSRRSPFLEKRGRQGKPSGFNRQSYIPNVPRTSKSESLIPER